MIFSLLEEYRKNDLQNTSATFPTDFFDKKFHIFTKIRQLLLYFVNEGNTLMPYILWIELLNSKKCRGHVTSASGF